MATVQKWGNSLAVRIPINLASQIDLQEGTEVDILLDEGSIVVSPKRRRKYDLQDLLRNCKPTQLHGETDWGADVGHEELN